MRESKFEVDLICLQRSHDKIQGRRRDERFKGGIGFSSLDCKSFTEANHRVFPLLHKQKLLQQCKSSVSCPTLHKMANLLPWKCPEEGSDKVQSRLAAACIEEFTLNPVLAHWVADCAICF